MTNVCAYSTTVKEDINEMKVRCEIVQTITDQEADFVLWTDASLHLGLAFVYAGRGFTYALCASTGVSKEKFDIFFFLELIAILSAMHHTALFRHPPQKVLLWTDSLDSVAAFNSLRAAEPLVMIE